MQLGFYYDQTRCTGCFTCVIACKDWNDIPAGPASLLRVKTLEKGKYPKVFVANMFAACYHCAQPACVDACPVGAITKRESDGIVIVDGDTCLGHDQCDTCLQVCQYDAPQFGVESTAKMQKCDLCYDRLAEGKSPICVGACPTYAIEVGPVDDLRARYSAEAEAEGFLHDRKMNPSIVFKAKKPVQSLSGVS